MTLMNISSPHVTSDGDAGSMMRLVLFATLPGLAMLTYWYGWGRLIHVGWAVLLALGFETIALLMRGRPVGFYLKDYSAVLTGVLLGLALPPLAPWWITLVGVAFAIIIAKHFFGGLGYNPFNPAMVGYVVLLISFPVQMTSWVAPRDLVEGQPALLSFVETFAHIFPVMAQTPVDGYTMATALDLFKQHQGSLADQAVNVRAAFGAFGAAGSEWVNLGYLVGGLFLLYKRVFTWHAPVGMLGALLLMSLLFHSALGIESVASPLFHWFSGATMLGAFFIITDPVTSATSLKGRLIYGFSIGSLIFIIRSWGNYPDAVAFSVLLMNFAAPFLDYYTQPRSFGQAAIYARKQKD